MKEKSKNLAESYKMWKDKELKCKLNLKMPILNGLANYKFSLLT